MSTPSVSYLIDSSIFITYLRGRQDIVLRLDALPNKFISPSVIAELAFGARRSRDPQRALANVSTVIGPLPVVDIVGDIGYDFAEVKNGLVVTNQLIPDTDIWIAVTAMAYKMTLVTRDAHFSRITPYGLALDRW